MAYVAVKGGEQAIAQAEKLLQQTRRGDPTLPELTPAQIEQQLGLAVDRVMAEGSLYDRELAALAIKQAMGDLVEAIFLLRAYRTTLARLYESLPLETDQLEPRRRISAIFKDVPGGQVLGPTFDYTYRLLDFGLGQCAVEPEALPNTPSPQPSASISATTALPSIARPSVLTGLVQEQLIQPEISDPPGEISSVNPPEHPPEHPPAHPPDLTRQPLTLPADRAARLQNLARGDEGFLLGLAYSTQRGYGNSHPFAGEVRMGEVDVMICPEELGFPVVIGEITVTEVQMINQFQGNAETPPQFTRGYGLTFGHNERKAMAMALVERSLRSPELGEAIQGPAQNEEFVLYHSDNVEAQGFVQHLKLPHYIDFQSELNLLRNLRREAKA